MEIIIVLTVLGAILAVFVGLVWFFSRLFARQTVDKELRGIRDRLIRLETGLPPAAGDPRARAIPVAPAKTEMPLPSVPQPAPSIASPEGITGRSSRDIMPPPPPSRSREEWEALIGGKLLNRVGSVALIFALAFFLKYAFDNAWITETTRLGIGVAVGAICLVGAARSAAKGYQIFSQGLVGAGIAILYLSVYASFNFYALVSQPVAFALMSVVTALAFQQAFRYNAFSVSALALLGGFATPLLLSTPSTPMVGLFSYVALLDAGIILILAYKEQWVGLEPLALLGTYLLFNFWYETSFEPELIWGAVGFLVLFWGMFHALDLYRTRREVVHLHDLRRLIATAHLAVFYGFLYVLLERSSTEAAAAGTLILGAILITSAIVVDGVLPLRRLHYTTAVVPGIVLVAVATGIQFHSFTRVTLWALEGLLALWIGVQIGRKAIWLTAILHFLFVLLSLPFVQGMFATARLDQYVPVFNARMLAFAVLGLTLFGSRHLALHGMTPLPRWVHDALQYGWLVVLFAAVTVEGLDVSRLLSHRSGMEDPGHIEYLRWMLIATLWVVLALPLFRRGLSTGSRPLLYGALGTATTALLVAAAQGLSYVPLSAFVPVANLRAVSLAVVFGGALLFGRGLAQANGALPGVKWLRMMYRIIPVVVVLVLVSSEIRDFFEQRVMFSAAADDLDTGAALRSLENLKQMTLSGVWVVLSAGLMAVGLWRRDRVLRVQSIVIFTIAILKIFIYDLSFLDTLYRIVSFFALGVILLFVSYLYQKYRFVILEPTKDGAGQG